MRLASPILVSNTSTVLTLGLVTLERSDLGRARLFSCFWSYDSLTRPPDFLFICCLFVYLLFVCLFVCLFVWKPRWEEKCISGGWGLGTSPQNADTEHPKYRGLDGEYPLSAGCVNSVVVCWIPITSEHIQVTSNGHISSWGDSEKIAPHS